MESIKQNNVSCNGETQNKPETAPVRVPPSRAEILLRLWDRAEWLKQRVDNTRTKLDENLKARVYLVNIESQIYKIMLYGMKEIELVQLEKDIAELKKMFEANKGNLNHEETL